MIRGFLTLEVLIALLIGTSTIVAVALLALGAPAVLTRSEEHRKALTYTEEVLQKTVSQSMTNYSDAENTASTTHGIFTTSVKVHTLPSDVEKRIEARTVWHDEYGLIHEVSLTTLVTDYKNPPDTLCASALEGNWDDPVVHSYTFSNMSLAAILSTSHGLVGVASSTKNKNDPTMHLFEEHTDGSLSILQSIDDAAGTVAGLTALTTHTDTIYVASGATCTGNTCGQLHIASFAHGILSPQSTLLLATSSAPFAKNSAGMPVSATSIAYAHDHIYLGLSKTTGGGEFNIIDVQDPLHPVWEHGYAVGATVTSIHVRGPFAYLTTNDATRDLIVLDIRDPRSIEVVGVYDAPLPRGIGGTANTIAFSPPLVWLARDYAQYAEELSAVNIENPANPTLVTSKNITSGIDSVSVYHLVLKDSRAFLLTKKDVQLWNITDANNPVFIKSIPLPQGSVGTGLTCRNHVLYVSSLVRGTTLISTFSPP